MLKRIMAPAWVQRWMLLGILVLALALKLTIDRPPALVRAQESTLGSDSAGPSLSGRVVDPLGEPVHDAEVSVFEQGLEEPLAQTTSQADGSYLVDLPPAKFNTLAVEFDRPHFDPLDMHLEATEAALLSSGKSVRLPDVEMQRRITPPFGWRPCHLCWFWC